MAFDPAQTTLAVLAGGQSRRMGTPKSHLQIAGQPILKFLLEQFAWPGPTLLVTAPGAEHPPAAERFHAEAIDPIAGQGPLRGVLTALEQSATPLTVVVTVDMPRISRDVVHWLLDRLAAHEHRLGVMGFHDGQIEPFPLAARRAAALLLAQRLAADQPSIHGLCQLPAFSCEPVPAHWPPNLWTNLNLPADYDAFVAALR